MEAAEFDRGLCNACELSSLAEASVTRFKRLFGGSFATFAGVCVGAARVGAARGGAARGGASSFDTVFTVFSGRRGGGVGRNATIGCCA